MGECNLVVEGHDGSGGAGVIGQALFGRQVSGVGALGLHNLKEKIKCLEKSKISFQEGYIFHPSHNHYFVINNGLIFSFFLICINTICNQDQYHILILKMGFTEICYPLINGYVG